MADHSTCFTNVFIQVTKTIGYLAKSEGTNIAELTRHLRLNRRSIFRLLRIIEDRLHIPIEVSREAFGGVATYHLASTFREKLSKITIPSVSLSFNQAIFVYLILKDEIFSKEADLAEEFSKVYSVFS